MEKEQEFLDISQVGVVHLLADRIYFSMMTKPAAQYTIPRYFLYGETPQDVDERFLHVESLADRGRLHNWAIRPHAHLDLYHLVLVLSGSGVFSVEGAMHPFTGPTLIGVPVSCVHGFESEPRTDGWIVTASAALLRPTVLEVAELSSLFADPNVLPLSSSAAQHVTSLFESLVNEVRGNFPGRRAAAKSWLTMLLVAAFRLKLEVSPAPQHAAHVDSLLVARYRTLMEAKFGTQLRIAEYARRLCVSHERLRQACLQSTGSSPLALLNNRRLLEAKRSLLYTNMSVALVAESCGFLDPAYFSRFFGRSTGKSPLAYRRKTVSANSES